jgi:hypothetical protein
VAREIRISSSVAVVALICGIALIVTDVHLLVVNKHQTEALEQAESGRFLHAGDTLPLLVGIDPAGQPLVVNPLESRTFLLLAFSPACHFCDQNWANWGELLKDWPTGKGVLFLSTSSKLSESYLVSHALGRRRILCGLNQDTARTYGLIATPQTALVVEGKIARVWRGVLKRADLEFIRSAAGI